VWIEIQSKRCSRKNLQGENLEELSSSARGEGGCLGAMESIMTWVHFSQLRPSSMGESFDILLINNQLLSMHKFVM